MKSERVSVHNGPMDEFFVSVESEIDEVGNVTGLYLIVDGELIAKKLSSNPDQWKVVAPGWEVQDNLDGKIACTPPRKLMTIH